MTPITRQDILAHQTVAPWSAQHQVEQDLLLCRAMVELLNDAFLSAQIAMRGGTLLHKAHLAPPSRYSEDIDLVVVGTRPEEHNYALLECVCGFFSSLPNGRFRRHIPAFCFNDCGMTVR